MDKKKTKNEYKKRFKELRQILNDWDFIEVAPSEGGPQDEYGSIAHGVLSKLYMKGVEADVYNFIQQETKEHFELELNEQLVRELSAAIYRWWDGLFRELTASEQNLLDLMLSKQFIGRDEIRQQASQSKVRSVIESDGSFWGIEFKVKRDAPKVQIEARVPVELRNMDAHPVQILLHVIDGYINELELVNFEGIQYDDFPTDRQWEVILSDDSDEVEFVIKKLAE